MRAADGPAGSQQESGAGVLGRRPSHSGIGGLQAKTTVGICTHRGRTRRNRLIPESPYPPLMGAEVLGRDLPGSSQLHRHTPGSLPAKTQRPTAGAPCGRCAPQGLPWAARQGRVASAVTVFVSCGEAVQIPVFPTKYKPCAWRPRDVSISELRNSKNREESDTTPIPSCRAGE